MQVATKVMLLAVFLLASCDRRDPDFEFVLTATHGRSIAFVMGFQPRGTIEGNLLLSFKNGETSDVEEAAFHVVTGGIVGWTSDNAFAVIGNTVTYRKIASDYYPDGTIHTKIRLIVCAREEMDCSSVEARMKKYAAMKIIPDFPES